MANITTYLENKLLDHATGRNSWTAPATTYAALFTASPTIAYTSGSTDGTEVSTTSTGYVRKAITWGAASGGIIANSAALTWSASGTWGTVNTICIFDALTNGNLLWFGPLSASVAMDNGDEFTIPVGQLTIKIV